MSPKRSYLLAFLGTVLAGLVFIFITDHRWEDWYITYRASKNLALGHGLTFTLGERVYSFTSPINTLLPALFAWLGQGGDMDELAILGYRLCSLAALGAASVLLLRLARRLALDAFHQVALLLLFVGNILILDFSTNGMEAAFMMLFLVLLADSLVGWGGRGLASFTCAFTGLMYTRPDWFVYAGPIAVFYLFFAARSQAPWRPLAGALVRALLISVLLYLPWILVTWLYYGSPVPNTISAKANLVHYVPLELLGRLLLFPYHLLAGATCAGGEFLPPYWAFGGWHKLHVLARLLSVLALSGVFWPRAPAMVRSLSLSASVAVFYLSFVSGQGAMPWYLPNVAVQAIIVLVCLSQLAARRLGRIRVVPFTAAALVFNFVVLGFASYQLRTQQQVIEYGTRRSIGLWLHDNASRGDTVFLECLGYIGFYSQLKTYDYPGMSSKEVVAEMRRLPVSERHSYGALISALHPDFVVLRPQEYDVVSTTHPGLLQQNYSPAAFFDSSTQLPDKWYLWGRPYLQYDSRFLVLKRLRQGAADIRHG